MLWTGRSCKRRQCCHGASANAQLVPQVHQSCVRTDLAEKHDSSLDLIEKNPGENDLVYELTEIDTGGMLRLSRTFEGVKFTPSSGADVFIPDGRDSRCEGNTASLASAPPYLSPPPPRDSDGKVIAARVRAAIEGEP